MRPRNLLVLLIITILLVLAKAADDDDADYDEGFVEHRHSDPKPQPAPVHHHAKHPEKSMTAASNSFKWTEATFYIPVAIISGVLLNAIVISILVVMKRRRVTAYRKLQLERATPVFREIQEEI